MFLRKVCMSEKLSKEEKGIFKDTLNLPRTDFPIRAQAALEDNLMIERWDREQLFEKAFLKNKGQKSFILHDGPPYANAHIHLGTAYNKILKDIVTKSERMTGKHVPVTPGWDCHGLPIELRVAAEHPEKKGAALKKECRAYASHWIQVQKEEFKRLGVVMNWNHPYLTMSPEYEAATVQAFSAFVKDGYISRKNKTVPWCADCQTVLASAEIEYYDKKDPSIYVMFPLQKHPFGDQKVSLLVWTTTPWTLPLNRAVFLKPGAEYVVLSINNQQVIVGKALADKVCAFMQAPKIVVAECKAEDLVGLFAEHPFIKNLLVPVCADHFVGLSDGTACVHCAPGCGPEDYEVGLKNGLEIYSPLSPDGKYTKGIEPQELEGMSIKDALGFVMTKLQESNALFYKTSLTHSFPHCWRCRNGLMFRATRQWFCELNHQGLQKKSLEAITKIDMIPEAMRNHLKASISGRLEWCLSRQRTWGTPIVALLCVACDKEYSTVAMMDYVIAGIKKEGIEYWDRVPLEELMPKGLACNDCGGTVFKKEQAILDVWFDSGISHYAVLLHNKDLGYPADMYLEGIDQHRGWFQSSLLTSMALENSACMKTIVTHGYTVDDKGRKMSKSLGNVTAPQELIDTMGTDGLRLWVASIEIQGDVVVSKALLANIQESYRKIRNTCRFLLQNLYDFDAQKDAIPVEKLMTIDQYALHELHLFNEQVLKAYAQRSLTGVYHAFVDYCTGQLSSFYLDIVKDRLYTDQADGYERRSAQTVCAIILETITPLMAPILSFTAEHISDYYQKDKKESIHLQDFVATQSVWNESAIKKNEEQWKVMRSVRSLVLKAIEQLRKKELIKHSLEAKVTLIMKTKTESTALIKEFLTTVALTEQSKEHFLKEFFIVSACDVVEEYEQSGDEEENEESMCASDDGMGLLVKASHAPGSKCPRCWQWEVTDNQQGLCKRCQKVVAGCTTVTH